MVISLTKDERDYLLAVLANEMDSCMASIHGDGGEWYDVSEDMEHIKNIERKLKKG